MRFATPLIVGGLILLEFGAEALVRGSSSVSLRLGIAILLFVLLGRGFRLHRSEGTLPVVGYIIYIYTPIP